MILSGLPHTFHGTLMDQENLLLRIVTSCFRVHHQKQVWTPTFGTLVRTLSFLRLVFIGKGTDFFLLNFSLHDVLYLSLLKISLTHFFRALQVINCFLPNF